MQYHHALALKESGKPAEARAIFDNVVKAFPASAEAPEAAWRSGQCRQEIIRAALQQAKVAMNKGDAKPEEKKAAGDAYAKALGELRETAQYFESTAGPVGQKAPGSEAHLRMFYEAAWCWRTVGDVEVETARAALAEESRKKAQDLATKNAEPGKPAPVVNAPIVALAAVPWQPAQQRAMEQYQQIVKAASDAPLAILARFEQAEMHAVRDAFDAAIPLLTEAIDLEPEQALSDRIRLRLGACHLGKNDATNAAEQFGQSIQSKNPLVAAESRYRTAEVKMLAKDFAGAIQLLVPFRDKGELHQFPGVSDRATLRLGHAYGYAGQWNESRQAMETLIGRYGNSEWKHEARYGMGWSLQNQKQWDPAIAQYREVTKATAAEVAARAQLQIGICLREQKKLGEAATALLVVPFTYDYPQWSGAALVEAAAVLKDMQQVDQAKALLNRAIKDYANTPWAKVAQERLAEMK